MRKPELYYRPPELVIAIIGHIETHDQPCPWDQVVAGLPDENFKTVERTMRALIEFGALHLVGKFTPGNDTRALRLSPLGVAWLDQELLPRVDDDHQWNHIDNE